MPWLLVRLFFQQAMFPEPWVMQFGLAAAGHSHPLPPPTVCHQLSSWETCSGPESRVQKTEESTVVQLLHPVDSLSFLNFILCLLQFVFT